MALQDLCSTGNGGSLLRFKALNGYARPLLGWILVALGANGTGMLPTFGRIGHSLPCLGNLGWLSIMVQGTYWYCKTPARLNSRNLNRFAGHFWEN